MEQMLGLEQIRNGVLSQPVSFVQSCEAAFQMQIDAAAQSILEKPSIRLVMLAGPSSSGKTTTAQKLRQSLRACGRRAWTVSLDDFYLDPRQPQLFEDGTPDYETVHALDLPFLETCLQTLLNENRCELPRFSFLTRQREPALIPLSIGRNDLVIVEGLHALHPLITDSLDQKCLFKLYVNVSSHLMQDNHVLLTKRELRFIRRMVRDHQFRASPVDHTFYLWNGVRKGEDRYLFPFRSRADLRIDSTHPYEPCVFQLKATGLLQALKHDSPYYETAQQLQRKLALFPPLASNLIPQHSLLHEFLG